MDPLKSQTPSNTAESQQSSTKGFWIEIIKFTIIALIVVMPIRLFIAQPFIVSGASMETTFETGQYLIVDQLTYHLQDPQRGQVIIFKYPKDTTKYFIKRVIGLPGETVELSGTSVIIHNKDHPDGFKLNEPYISSQYEKEDYRTIGPLPAGQYFVMGDNRLQSSDSRAWGTVPRDLIIGTPFLRLFPLNLIGIYPGGYKEAN